MTVLECEKSVDKWSLNKSRGLDGLTAEFYKTFWPVIGEFLTTVFNEGFDNGSLSNTQTESVLTLIYKKGDSKQIKNYRPISITNIDYKILAFVLAERMQKALPNLISRDQTAYIKGRNITQNIRIVQDSIDYVNQKKMKKFLLFLDFEKAFDSVEHNVIYKTLETFNFGAEFIHWIKTIYSKCTAMVKNNGNISQPISIARGIKQGCPVSALLFILAIETLALTIKRDNKLQGLTIKVKAIEYHFKISQYADDCTVCISSIDQIPRLFERIDFFSNVAGLKINIEKTEGLGLGSYKGTEGKIHGVTFRTAPFKFLGVYIGNDSEECQKKNWDEKIQKIQRTLLTWKKRDLTIFGKVTVIKSLILPIITYTAQSTCTPPDSIKHINKLLFNFIWGKRDRIKRNILYQNISQGGVNMIDVNAFFTSLKAAWLPRILNRCDTWNCIAHKYFSFIGDVTSIKNVHFENEKSFEHTDILPSFYKEVVFSFAKANKYSKPVTKEQCLEQPIWGNKDITMFNKNVRSATTLVFKEWADSGIYYVKDLHILDGNLDQKHIENSVINKRDILRQIVLMKKALKPLMTIIENHQPGIAKIDINTKPELEVKRLSP